MRGNYQNSAKRKVKKRYFYLQKISPYKEIINLRKRRKKQKIVRQITKKRFS